MAKRKTNKKAGAKNKKIAPVKKAQAKPKRAKKKISVTEQKLRNKLRYERSKLRPFIKEIEKVQKYDGRKKHVYKGKKRAKNTIINSILNEAKKVNNKVVEIETKLERFKYKRKTNITLIKKDNERLVVLSNVWEKKNAENEIFGGGLKTLNGKDIKKEADKVQQLIDNAFLRMDSKLVFALVIDRKGNAKISIQNGDNDEVDESEY